MQQATIKAETQQPTIWVQFAGRSAFYTPEDFKQEAAKYGGIISRRVKGISGFQYGDVLLFVKPPQKIKRGEAFFPELFGYLKVTQLMLSPQTEAARQAFRKTVNELITTGKMRVVASGEQEIVRRCGRYTIVATYEICSFEEFRNLLLRHYSVAKPERETTARGFVVLIAGPYTPVDPPILLPIQLKWLRMHRKLRENELIALFEALNEHSLYDALLSDPNDPPKIVELINYVKAAIPRKSKRLRVNQTEQLVQPVADFSEPLAEPISPIEQQPTLSPNTLGTEGQCLVCGNPTKTLLCDACREQFQQLKRSN